MHPTTSKGGILVLLAMLSNGVPKLHLNQIPSFFNYMYQTNKKGTRYSSSKYCNHIIHSNHSNNKNHISRFSQMLS